MRFFERLLSAVKPVDFEQFRETVKSVGLYWLVINQPPVMESSEHLAGLAHD